MCRRGEGGWSEGNYGWFKWKDYCGDVGDKVEGKGEVVWWLLGVGGGMMVVGDEREDRVVRVVDEGFLEVC